MFYLTSFESYSDESELTYLVLCFLLLFLLLRLTLDELVSTSDESVYTTLNYVLNAMNTDTTVQKLLQEFRYIVGKYMLQNSATQSEKVQARTHLSTDYQTNKQIHPSVKFTIKINTKMSPAKPPDTKIRK